MKKGKERYPSSFSHLKQPSLVSLVDLLGSLKPPQHQVICAIICTKIIQQHDQNILTIFRTSWQTSKREKYMGQNWSKCRKLTHIKQYM